MSESETPCCRFVLIIKGELFLTKQVGVAKTRKNWSAKTGLDPLW